MPLPIEDRPQCTFQVFRHGKSHSGRYQFCFVENIALNANRQLIGEASCRTHDENGLAVWTLRIGKEEIPGRWVIVDRGFRLVQ